MKIILDLDDSIISDLALEWERARSEAREAKARDLPSMLDIIARILREWLDGSEKEK